VYVLVRADPAIIAANVVTAALIGLLLSLKRKNG
jgi:hypothetical protein